jgi:hypothetical protein
VLTDGQGHVTEGPGFNVFAVFGHGAAARLVTPASGVLEGVTRRTVMEVAQAQGLAVEPRLLGVEELRRADEIFLSTSGGGVVPVSHLDGVPVAGARAGLRLTARQRCEAPSGLAGAPCRAWSSDHGHVLSGAPQRAHTTIDRRAELAFHPFQPTAARST